MKRTKYVAGLLLAAVLTAGGCGNGGDGSGNVTRLEDMQQSIIMDPAQGQLQSEENTQAPEENGTVVEILQEVLRGNREFEGEDGESWRIDQMKEVFGLEDADAMCSERFTLVDMDGDGEPEAVVQVDYPMGNLVLRCQGDEVYGYAFFIREMNAIKTDGSFLSSGGAADTSLCRLSFDGRECRVDEFAYSRSSYDSRNNLVMAYAVNSREATVAEYDAAYSQWEELPGVEWYDFTEAKE